MSFNSYRVNIIGISAYYHDSAAAIVIDGEVIAAAQEERFSRVKYDFSFPKEAISFCLDRVGISSSQLDAVVFFEKPLRKFERAFYTIFKEFPSSFLIFEQASINWFKKKLWIREQIIDYLNISRNRIYFIPHHLSHAASAFFCSPFDEAAIITVDGVGEWTTASICRGSVDSIEILKELYFPHSLGLLYSTFTTFLGFQVNEENKLMGLAAFGNPIYREEVRKVAKLNEDGSVELNLSYFSYTKSRKRMFSSRFLGLFGEPRLPNKSWILGEDT